MQTCTLISWQTLWGYCLSDCTCRMFLNTDNPGDLREMFNWMWFFSNSQTKLLFWEKMFDKLKERSKHLAQCLNQIKLKCKLGDLTTPLYALVVFLTDGRQDSALNLTTNGTGSISMSVELNGVVYTGEHRCFSFNICSGITGKLWSILKSFSVKSSLVQLPSRVMTW